MKKKNKTPEHGGEFNLEPTSLPDTVNLDTWAGKPAAAPLRYLADAALVGLKWRNCVITLEEITPERALAYSLMVPTDRRVNRDYRAANLAKLRKVAITEGLPFNGDSLVFNRDEHLINGKHRVKIGYETQKTFTALVVRGVDNNTFAHIDAGQIKRFEDMLFASGYTDVKNLASAIKIVDEYKTTGQITENTGGYSQSQAPELAAKYEGLGNYGHTHAKQIEDYLTRSIVMAMHYLLAEHDKEKADAFFEKLISGIGITSSKDSIYCLRKTLRDLKKQSNELRTGLNRKIAGAFIIKAWNGVVTGQPVRTFRFAKDEEFPKILTPGKNTGAQKRAA